MKNGEVEGWNVRQEVRRELWSIEDCRWECHRFLVRSSPEGLGELQRRNASNGT